MCVVALFPTLTRGIVGPLNSSSMIRRPHLLALAAATLGWAAMGEERPERGPLRGAVIGEAAVEKAETPVPAARAAMARDLVEQLAADRYRDREAATNALWELGEEALGALEEGTASPDPEVAHRANLLLQRIRTGITPGTPEAVVDLVQRYFRSGVEGKEDVFQELNEQNAYRQMLRLYRFEKDPEAREACSEILDKAILPAVLGELVAGRREEAWELLQLTPFDDENCRRRAAFMRVQGELDNGMAPANDERLFAAEGNLFPGAGEKEAATMRLALLRAAGRTGPARELAEQLGRDDLVASLALFEGDPAPYLTWFAGQQGRTPVLRLHAGIALKRWQGDEEGAARDALTLAELARDGGEEEREALLSLMLNGYFEHALPVIERDYPEAAFSYFEMTEQPARALAAIDYAGTAGEQRAWREERFAGLREEWEAADRMRYDLLTLAAFLHARGEEDEALEIMEELAAIAREDGEERWREFLGQLQDMGGSLHELAFRAASAQLGEEAGEKDAKVLLALLFGEDDAARRLWRLLEGASAGRPAQRLLLLGAIYGVVHMPPEQLDPVLEALAERAAAADADDRVKHFTALLEAAETRDDAGTVISLLEELNRLDEATIWSAKLAAYSSHLAEWEKAAAAFGSVTEAEPTNLRFLALQAGALLRAGRPAEAGDILERIELFSLDEAMRLRQLAGDLDRQGALAEAEHYWKLLLATCSPNEWYWHPAAEHYARHAKRGKRWRQAAAFAEVDAMQYIRGRSTYLNPLVFIRKRFAADLYRGLALLDEGNEPAARKIFRSCFELLNGDGLLADDYFPLLREAGLVDEHDRNYRIVAKRLEESIKAYPDAHNTYNSAAWTASRACRDLDRAHELIRAALDMRPRQAAYLDTMAEVWFAKRDRAKAVEWSRRALTQSYHGGSAQSEGGVGLRDQYERFRNDPFPVP